MVKKNTSWGGRFKKETAKKAQTFSSSINIDNIEAEDPKMSSCVI